MIDFAKIDRKKVLILCRHPEGIAPLCQLLNDKSFEIKLEKVPGDFFQEIPNFNPGFVMISNEMNIQMGKVFPHFIQKKFKIPVLLFPEGGGKSHSPIANENFNSPLGGAVRSAKPGSDKNVLEEIEQFEKNYNDHLSGLTKKSEKPTLDQLRKERIRRQNAVFQKLSDKIKQGLPHLMKKNDLDLLTIKLADPSGQGSFLFFTELPQGLNLEELKAQLAQEVSHISGTSPEIELVPMKIDNPSLQALLKNSDKAIHGLWGDLPISLFYFKDTAPTHHETTTIFEGGYLVPIEEWWSKLPLTFDASLFLKHNSKIILYIRKGNIFPEEQVKRFIEKQQSIWIVGDDFHHFETFSEISNLILRTKEYLAIAA
jgi:hypothetical protein